MKVFTNKNLIQKFIIVFVCIFLLEFCISTPKVQAAGGKLFAPVKQFLTAVADIFVSTVQWAITGQWISAVEDNAGVHSEGANNNFWKRKIDFPIIQISPELIFANQIELLNIDFISSPKDNESDEGEPKYIIEDDSNAMGDLRVIIASWYVTLRTIAIVGLLSVLIYIGIRIIISSTAGEKSKYKQMLVDWVIAFCIVLFMHFIMSATVNIVNKVDELLADACNVKEGIDLQAEHGGVEYNPQAEFEDVDDVITAEDVLGDVSTTLDNIENIGRIYISGIHEWFHVPDDDKMLLCNAIEEGILFLDGPYNSQGIRDYNITNGTIEYRYIFTDDAIDYYMVDNEIGTLTIKMELVEGKVIRGSATTDNTNTFINVYSNPDDPDYPYDGINGYFGNRSEVFENQDIEISQAEVGPSKYDGLSLVTFTNGKTALISDYSKVEGGGSKILYFMNYARLYVNAYDTYTAFGYLILYIILTFFTVMFTIRYMKRVIYIAFLTLIAPLVALTYPIDKLRDGKAQAFNMWFREYIFNVIIQPFHLLIYTILVGSAMALASSYMIYAIIAIAFLIPAENLLRSFFGFDKAGTLSVAGSFAGGALFSSMINKINKSKSGGVGGTGRNEERVPTIRTPSTTEDFNAQNIVLDMVGYKNGGAKKLSKDEQAEKTALENYFKTTSNEDAYMNPEEYQTKLDRLQELEKLSRGEQARKTGDAYMNTEGYQTKLGGMQGLENKQNNQNDQNKPNQSERTIKKPATASSASTISSLTAPVFNPGDKWRIATGQRQVKGKWVKDKWAVNEKTGEYITDQNGKKIRNQNRKTQGLWTRTSNSVQSAAYMPYRQIADKVKTIPKTTGRLVRKGVIGGIAGGTLGTIGLAVGVASGDPSKAFKYAAAGTAAGYYGANHYGDKVAKASGEVANSAKTGFWGEDMDKIEQSKFDNEFTKNPKNIDTLTRALGTREKAKDAIKKGHVQAFLKHGVTDPAKIGKALTLWHDNKLGAKNDADGLEKAVALTVWDQRINHSIYDRTSLHRAAFIEREVEELVESGIDEKTATEKVEQILKNLEYLNS